MPQSQSNTSRNGRAKVSARGSLPMQSAGPSVPRPLRRSKQHSGIGAAGSPASVPSLSHCAARLLGCSSARGAHPDVPSGAGEQQPTRDHVRLARRSPPHTQTPASECSTPEQREMVRDIDYPSNHVVTSKYRWWTFLPKSLFEQFRRVANVYFLLISILQLSTPYSPTNRLATVLPLTLVLLVSMAKEAVEDRQRHQADDKVNRAKTQVMQRDSGGGADAHVDATKPAQVPAMMSGDSAQHAATMQSDHAGGWTSTLRSWSSLRVGEIVCLRSDDQVPADLLVLYSSGARGLVHIETSNLDGESTALKMRQSVAATQEILQSQLDPDLTSKGRQAAAATPPDFSRLAQLIARRARIECELPNRDLYHFEGTLEIDVAQEQVRDGRPANGEQRVSSSGVKQPGDGSAAHQRAPSASASGAAVGIIGGPTPADRPYFGAAAISPVTSAASAASATPSTKHALSLSNMVWRGTVLRNTALIWGVVVFTGPDTKLIRNSSATPSKRSNIDKTVNNGIIVIFLTLALLCTLSTILYASRLERGAFYLPFLAHATTADVASIWITFLILYNNLVPISLYVSLEMIKMIQARLIQWDRGMRCPETGQYALARTSNLNEDCGQIEYVFSDKTGTLTQNKMEFSQCSVGGIIYGSLAEVDDTTTGNPTGNEIAAAAAAAAASGSLYGCGGSSTPSATTPNLSSKIQSRKRASLLANQQRIAAAQQRQQQQQQTPRGTQQPQHSLHASHNSFSANSPPPLALGRGIDSGLPVVPAAASAATTAAAPMTHSTQTTPLFGSATASSTLDSSALLASDSTPPPASAHPPVAGYAFDDLAFLAVLSDPSHPNHLRAREFVLCLALCHAVMPQVEQESSSITNASGSVATSGLHISYHSASPDDTSLVITARQLGFELYDRGANFVRLRVKRPARLVAALAAKREAEARAAAALASTASPATGSLLNHNSAATGAGADPSASSPASSSSAAADVDDVVYEVLNENAFSSDRRCMSVIVRSPSGELLCFVKGADEVVLPRLRADLRDSDEEALVKSHLSTFASEGLRTLVMAKAILDEREYALWNARFQEAKLAVNTSGSSSGPAEKERALAHLASEVERNLLLIGASAIEDKLQAGVPETIVKLAQAGIKVWMLTGDKLETGINIGYSCRLLQGSSQLVKLTGGTAEYVSSILASAIKRYEVYLGRTHPHLCVIVSGKALALIFPSDTLRTLFLQLCRMSKVVIACRCLPSQKSAIVRLVRHGLRPEPMTLAIGDGANDVAMLQEAAVGVGISGNEGMQAVRAADYAISQFRFLERLLFVHGRWNYSRVCTLILYSFYKNIVFVFVLFFFGFYNGFSGTTLYDSWLGTMYNVAFTVAPVLLMGVLEQDVSAEAAVHNPTVYLSGAARGGQFGRSSTMRRGFVWLATAIFHSLLVFFLCVNVFQEDAGGGGSDHSVALTILGSVINFVVVATVTLKMAIMTRYWTVPTLIGMVGSLLVWFVFVLVYAQMLSVSFDYFNVATHLLRSAQFWLTALLVPVTANVLDFAVEHVTRWWDPSPVEIVAERSREAQALGLPLDFQAEYEAALRQGSNNSSNSNSTRVRQPSAKSGASTKASSRLDSASTIELVTQSMGTQQQQTEEIELDEEEKEKARMHSELLAAAAEARAAQELREQAQGIGGVVNGKRALEDRKDYLRRILSGDPSQGAAIKSKLYTSVDNITVLDRIGMHWAFLHFVNQPELEDEFRNKYVLKSLRLTRISMTVLFALMCAFAIWTAALQQDQWLTSVVVTGVAGVALVVLVWPRWFRKFFTELLFLILIGASIVKNVLVTENGSVGMLIFAIACFLLLRLRFVNACMIVAFDLTMFSIYISAASTTSLSQEDVLRIDYLHIILCLFCGYACHRHEAAFRRDFLWQKVYHAERARTQIILDNLLPPHISKQMNEGRQRREKERLATLGTAGKKHPNRGGIRRIGSFFAGTAQQEAEIQQELHASQQPTITGMAAGLGLSSLVARTAQINRGQNGVMPIRGAETATPKVQAVSLGLSPMPNSSAQRRAQESRRNARGAEIAALQVASPSPEIEGYLISSPDGDPFRLDDSPLNLPLIPHSLPAAPLRPTGHVSVVAEASDEFKSQETGGLGEHSNQASAVSPSVESAGENVMAYPRSSPLAVPVAAHPSASSSAPAPTAAHAHAADDSDSSSDNDAEFDEATDGIYAPKSRNPRYLSGIPASVFQPNLDIIAHVEPEISILFCDILGFAGFLAKRSPAEVVAILDGVYSTFDELCVIYGLMKMETVGKTFMCAAGLRGTRKDHAHACAEIAFDMIASMKEFTDADMPATSAAAGAGAVAGGVVGNEVILPRIGIHTGIVISGVVGLKRPQFCLFGDTVNTASRMQSTGAIDRVHISATTHKLLHKDYTCIPRQVEVKGKGKMNTFYIEQKLVGGGGGGGGGGASTSVSSQSSSTASSSSGASIASPAPLVVRPIAPTIQRKRSFRLLEAETSVPEVLEMIRVADSAGELDYDPYFDAENPVYISPLTLRFAQRGDETEYMSRNRLHAGRASRFLYQIAVAFMLVNALFEVFLDESQIDPSLSLAQARGIVFGFRYGFILLCLAFYPLTYHSSHFARNVAQYNTIIFGFGMAGCLCIPLLAFGGSLDFRACTPFLFLMTLLSNSGTLRFVPNFMFNLGSAIAWAAVSRTLGNRDQYQVAFTFYVIAGCIINLVSSYAHEYYTRREFVLTLRVRHTRDKSAKFLYQMLPKYVALELREGLMGRAKKYEQVTILYSDIKGFTAFSSRSSPDVVVHLLASLFSAFDRLTDIHGVYKIQTIGDAYVLVGGFPFLEAANRKRQKAREALAAAHAAMGGNDDNAEKDAPHHTQQQHQPQSQRRQLSQSIHQPHPDPPLSGFSHDEKARSRKPSGVVDFPPAARKGDASVNMSRRGSMDSAGSSSEDDDDDDRTPGGSAEVSPLGQERSITAHRVVARRVNRKERKAREKKELLLADAQRRATGIALPVSSGEAGHAGPDGPLVGEGSMTTRDTQAERVAEPHIHAVNVVRMAMDMLAVIKRNSADMAAQASAAALAGGARAKAARRPHSIEMRIGIHTGDIIAGVIGTKQLRYDIWGADCLIANTMESNGIPSGIVVSASSAPLVSAHYDLIPLDPIAIKGGTIGAFAVAAPKNEHWERLRTVFDKEADRAAEARREERRRVRQERKAKEHGALIAVRATTLTQLIPAPRPRGDTAAGSAAASAPILLSPSPVPVPADAVSLLDPAAEGVGPSRSPAPHSAEATDPHRPPPSPMVLGAVTPLFAPAAVYLPPSSRRGASQSLAPASLPSPHASAAPLPLAPPTPPHAILLHPAHVGEATSARPESAGLSQQRPQNASATGEATFMAPEEAVLREQQQQLPLARLPSPLCIPSAPSSLPLSAPSSSSASSGLPPLPVAPLPRYVSSGRVAQMPLVSAFALPAEMDAAAAASSRPLGDAPRSLSRPPSLVREPSPQHTTTTTATQPARAPATLSRPQSAVIATTHPDSSSA